MGLSRPERYAGSRTPDSVVSDVYGYGTLEYSERVHTKNEASPVGRLR